MPYISPKGAVSRSAPRKGVFKTSAPPPSKPETEAEATKTPSEADAAPKPLYLIDSGDTRPMDPKVVEELDQWDGWNRERECPAEEEDVDPLDEVELGAGAGAGEDVARGKAA